LYTWEGTDVWNVSYRTDGIHQSAQLAKVGDFVLPDSHASYTINQAPATESLPDLNLKWILLRQKWIAYKFHDGWKISNVWRKGIGLQYGGKLWVTYGKYLRAGYEFEPRDYGQDRRWVLLTAPAAPGKTKAGKTQTRRGAGGMLY
jgi:hypothetical protein